MSPSWPLPTFPRLRRLGLSGSAAAAGIPCCFRVVRAEYTGAGPRTRFINYPTFFHGMKASIQLIVWLLYLMGCLLVVQPLLYSPSFFSGRLVAEMDNNKLSRKMEMQLPLLRQAEQGKIFSHAMFYSLES